MPTRDGMAVTVVAAPAPAEERDDTQSASCSRVLWLAFVVGVGAVGWWSARYGFHPTDEGLIAAASRRVLAGQVPHGEFITPRPVGSALLHLPELLLPTPLLLTSRFLALGQLALVALLFVRLASGQPIRSWGPGLVLAVTVATVGNAHTFPLTAWHTIDGIALSAVALWAWHRWRADGRAAHLALALSASGTALTVKQSFAPLAVALAIGAVRHRAGGKVLLVAIPGAAYLAWLLVGGALGDAVTQMAAAETPSLTAPLVHGAATGPGLVGAATGTLLVAARRTGRQGVLVAVVVTASVVGMGATAGLARGGSWGVGLFWAAAISLGAEAVRPREGSSVGASRAAPLGVLLVAWECCLSWGYAVPNLVAGSLGASVLVLAWTGVDLPSGRRWASPVLRTAAATAGIALVVSGGIALRRADIYRSEPASRLTVDLGSVAAGGRGILVDQATAGYVASVRTCQATFDAERVAILPDNPALYPLLDLDSPLPTDWLYPAEIAGVEDRVDEALARAASDDEALVLFQVRSVEGLSGDVLRAARPGDLPFAHGRATRFGSEGVPCGPFMAYGGAAG